MTRYLTALLLTLPIAAQTLHLDESHTRLTFPTTRFLAELPITNPGPITTAKITLNLLDPLNNIRSQATTTCTLPTATTTCTITLPPASPEHHTNEDIAPFRLRYTIETPGQPPLTGTLALDHIAPTLYILHAATPEKIRPGSFYSVRIRATHPLTHAPQPNIPLAATVTADIDSQARTVVSKHLTTDHNGFTTLEFTTPNNPALDSITIAVEGRLTNLHTGIQQDINVPNQKSLALTTDKPLYQPGQTAHLRLLAIDRRGHARPNAKLKIDIRDPDSTLIFRTEATTSHFGIASADWTIPARLRLGNYSIAVNSDDEDGDNDTSAKAEIRISRYDLPTFTVVTKPDKPFYLPNQNASVEVRATYLFGKPVLHGHVRVVRETDRQWNFEKQKFDTKEGAVYQGDLDKTGTFTAHVNLSEDGKSLDTNDPNHYEDLHLAAYVTDASTGRTEQRRFDLRISAQPLHVRFIPDDAYPKGLPIGFTLSVTTADGLPVPNAAVRIALLPASSEDPNEILTQRVPHAVGLTEIHTNTYGLARVDNLPLYAELLKRMPPPVSQRKPLSTTYEPWQINDNPHLELLATARTADNRTGLSSERFDEPSATLRLITDHALYKPGDPIQVTLTSAEPDLPINLQLLRNTSSGLITLATENLTLHNGRATLTLPSGTEDKPDPRFTGYLTITAVALDQDHRSITPWAYDREIPAKASRTVLFPRDNSLHVDVKLNHATYRPGDTATATVNVKGPQDSDGEDSSPARTALGLVAIDQAVSERNRSDNDFGNQPTFFFPWRTMFNSNNEVAGLTLLNLEQRDPTKPFTPDLDLAAQVLLNNAEPRIELTDNAPSNYPATVFDKLLNSEAGQPRKAIEHYLESHPDAPTTIPELDALLAPNRLSISALRDPWDTPFRLTSDATYQQFNLTLMSNGPDKLPNTPDDFTIPLASWNWFARHESDLRRVLIDHHQRTGAFIRDLPTLTAAMQADHIDFTAWRDPWNHPFTWTFTVQQADLAVTAITQGPPSTTQSRGYSFPAGSASISWFTDDRLRIQTALNDYTKTHTFPTTQPELDAALKASKLSLADFKDPLGHILYANFRTRSIFTDRVTVEARAHAGATPQKHTTVTPITAVIDTIDLRSDGPDGPDGVEGGFSPLSKPPTDPGFSPGASFTAASFSHVRSEQSAKEASPQKPTAAPTQSGEPTIETGAITGTITDPTGATIPNASIVATNTATQAEFEIKSNEDGTYLLNPLPAGTYTVRFDMPGFQRTIIDQVHVLSPDTTLLDVKLSVGSVNQAVEVSADAVSLSTESASVSGVAAGVFGGIAAGRLPATLFKSAHISYGLMAPPPSPPTSTPRIREYFPETLLWRPEILTTDDGNASIRFPIADTITTWQLGVAASTLRGNTGGASTTFTTFLPFFAAFDPPQTLTVGDQIDLPITLRNYLTHPITVHSTLTAVPSTPTNLSSQPPSAPSKNLSSRPLSTPTKNVSSRPERSAMDRPAVGAAAKAPGQPREAGVQGGFSPLSKPPTKPGFSPGQPEQFLRIDTPPPATTVPASDSASPIARITALAPAISAKLLFTARPENATGDSIERPITIHPDGLESAVTTAGIITGPTTFDLTIPADALPNSTDATLKIYPNLAAHLRDALTAMDAYPNGCAEQIISTAWPSLLLQRYAATLPTPDKPLKSDTRLRLEAAYANLLSDRNIDGGFRYWSNDPRSDLALTAYAIEFLTAAKPWIAIDDNVIKNAVDYLTKQQSQSGLWIRVDRDNKPHPEDADGNAMLTASIAAMISAAPNTEPLIQKALTASQPFIESGFESGTAEPYTLANYALAAIAIKDPRSKPAIARLRTLALSENGGAYWSLETNTPFFGWGTAGRVESTAAVLRALLASGVTSHDDLITRGLLFLDHAQDRHSLWYSTQATARALDVLAAIALHQTLKNRFQTPQIRHETPSQSASKTASLPPQTSPNPARTPAQSTSR